MLFPQKIDVVASARHANPHNETVVVQNDTAVEFYVAVVGDNGQTELPEGATYTLVCLHLRKEPTEKLGTLQEDGNVMFKLTRMELSETGPVQAQVRVYHPEGGRLTSNPFTFHVAPDPTYGAEIKPEDQSIIEQVIGEGPGIIAEAKEETEKNITERDRLTGAVGDALDSLEQDKADALLEMSQSKTAADESAQTALQAADNADQERVRLTQEVSDKITEVESARSATVEATGEALDAADLATQEADAARLQKQEVQDILGAGPVASVNGKTGVVDGLATTAQLAEKLNQGEVSVSDIDKNKGKFDQTYMTDEFLQQMAGTTPINAVPADDSITLKKVAFKKISTNRLDKIIHGEYVDRYTDEVIVSSGFNRSDYIAVEPNTTYIFYNTRAVVYYDESKTRLSSFGATSPYYDAVFTTPVDCNFIRAYWASVIPDDLQRLNKGNTLLPYEPHYVVIDKDYVEKPDIQVGDIPDVPIEKLDFSQKKSNLFNKNIVLTDTSLYNSSGSTSSANGFVASDFIPIEGDNSYIIRATRTYALYDSAKAYISGKPDTTAQLNLVITAPSNAYYIRFSWYPPGDGVTLDDQQMNEGTQLLPYESFGYEIPSEYLKIPSEADGVKVNLPPEIYAVTGKEINVYFQNIVNVPLNDYQIDVSSTLGKQYAERWTATPTASGSHNITISIYKDFKMIFQGTSTIIVKDANVGTGVNKNAIIIGDSTIAQDSLVNYLEDIFVSDPLTIDLLGTLGTYGELHNEGRAGWTISDYRTNKTYNDVVQPFYNPNTGDFDFSYYMTNQGYTNMEYAVLCLGINDTFSYKSDSALLEVVPNVLSDFDFVVNSILSYDANIKVGICVTIPPNESQDAFGEAYSNGQTQWRYKRNNALWIEQLISHFKNRTNERIYLVPDNNNIDAKTGFRDAVHPNKEVGDLQRADTFYYWFKSFEG